jgi:predicted transcriptional regulator
LPDPGAKRLFWYLFAGSRGGESRMRIIMHLKERPANTNQLAEALGMDYKAIQHHLDVLAKNNLVVKQGEKYGVLFFISPYLEINMDAFEEIRNRIGKK